MVRLDIANYGAAVQLLKKRYGKDSAIQKAHLNDLLDLSPVNNERDTPRLRRFCDDCETHYRGLEALGVAECVYPTIVVPALLQKLPEGIRLTITRGREFDSWRMGDLLKVPSQETELREEHYQATSSKNKADNIKATGHSRRSGDNTTSALFAAKAEDKGNCVFCLGNHVSDNCIKVKDSKTRKAVLIRYARCLKCLRKNHIGLGSVDQKMVIVRNAGVGIITLCDKQRSQPKGQQSQGVEVESSVGNNISSSSSHVVTTDGQSENFHVGASGKIALQTAKGIIKGFGESRARARVLGTLRSDNADNTTWSREADFVSAK